MKRIEIVVLIALIVASCSKQEISEVNIMSAEIKNNISILQSHKIFFGHQSVGRNIMNGIKDILAQYPEYPLNLVAADQLPADSSQPYFADANIGKNEKPFVKCDDYYNMLMNKLGSNPDLALMKFCYIDFNENTNPQELFAYYADNIKSIQEKYPGLKIVHVTVPLEARSAGWKRTIKKLLGKQEMTDLLNARREEYNNLLRQQYAEDSIFDLARIESTYPDGRREFIMLDGKENYSLINAYTDDGAHLNKTGRRIAAIELLKTLATALQTGMTS